VLDEADTEQNQLFSAEGSSHVTGGKSGFFVVVLFVCLFCQTQNASAALVRQIKNY